MGRGTYPWEQNEEENLRVGHLRPSRLHQVSRQHITLDLNFRPLTIVCSICE